MSAKYFLLYDFETSTRYFFGQILTCYFVLTDQNFNVVTDFELDLKIQISPIELPDPEAILVNKIDVLKHQEESISESQACFKINQFLLQCIDYAGEKKVKLMGYNSSGFDLPYLRTTFIRNGYSPYYYGNLLYADALNYVKKVAQNNDDFPITWVEVEGGYYGSFSLENVSRNLGVLNSVQTHDAKEDVVLMKDVLKLLQNKYSIDFWDYETFQVNSNVFQTKTGLRKKENGEVFWRTNYFYQLDENKNAVLFVNLQKYLNGDERKSIQYCNKNSQLIQSTAIEDDYLFSSQLISQIEDEFKDIKVDNFFEKSECDIEQDIYRLNFKHLNSLCEKIHKDSSLKSPFNKDFNDLWERFQLRSLQTKKNINTNTLISAENYFKKRYLEGFKINKNNEENIRSEPFHKMNERLENLLKSDLSDHDRSLMLSLKSFYKDSYFSKVMT